MLPAAYATPAATIFVIGGFLACFAGYRLFRLVLGLYGFISGALITTSMMGALSTWALIVAAVVGGLVGALLMMAAYFIGVGLIGAGLAALALNVVWHFVGSGGAGGSGGPGGGDPPTVVLVVVCVLGALAALSVVRHVVIFGTAIAGSWTLIVGALALLGDPAALHAASAGDVWIVNPLDPLASRRWLHIAIWFVIALAGVVVQMATTSGVKRKVPAGPNARRP